MSKHEEQTHAMPFGSLPAWEIDDLPAPLPFTFRNLLRTIGPGAILLASSIGGGEWLIGPAIAVKYGNGILWIATVAILLQLILNLEGIRYTLYTGEPIIIGIMRLRPGFRLWSSTYIVATIAQLGVPALAAGCASVLFATFASRLADTADVTAVTWLTYGVIASTALILLSGRTIERMLEVVSTVMIVCIMSFLLVANCMFVPLSHWIDTLVGFFQFGHIPMDVDAMLLATFAATAGSGGVGNLVITNWYRDKGFGMGAKVGAIRGALSDSSGLTTAVGKVFPITEQNLSRWREWWRYVNVDQIWLWGCGCFVGMYLNVNLATHVIPSGTEMDHMAAGAFQAKYMAEQLWSGFWFLALLNGFWALFSTHLGNTDILIRTVTDILWVSSPYVRKKWRMTISRLYYTLLAVFTVWGMIAVHWGHAMTLFKILGTIAGPVLAIAGLQILAVNTTLLPVELRPKLWRRAALVLCTLCYSSLSIFVIWDLFFK